MKKMVLVLALLTTGALLFAQVNLPEYRFAAGKWAFSGGRLYQNDATARLAKMNVYAPQTGLMEYEFDARYESGAEDGQAGFGLHIFMDSPYNGPSWGGGKSYLLWLNYDEKPVSRNIPTGFSAQIYRSVSNSRMDLVQSFDLNEYAYLLTEENLSYPVHVKILADGNTGEVQVFDPTDDNYYFELQLGKRDTPLKGNWVALRTNSVSLSFTN